MTNYSDTPGMVRMDFYQPRPAGGGKWYTTEAVDMTAYYGEDLLEEAIRKSLVDHFDGKTRLRGMIAVVAEPYHRNAHPMMVRVP